MNGNAPPATDGERIATLVVRLNISPAVVQNALGLPVGVNLEDVYGGRHSLSPNDLVAVADVLDVPVTVLTGQLPMDRHLGVSLRLGAVAAPDVPAEALEQAEMMLSHQALLDSWLGPVRNPLAGLPVSWDRYFLKAGQTTAARVRDALGMTDNPVTDLVGLIESLGAPVSFQPLPGDVHGLNVRDEREGAPSRVIIVSSGGPWTMQRFTLAHELCHALYDDSDQVIVDRVDIPEVLPELRAESFARHMLLPADPLRAEVTSARGRAASWPIVVANLMVRWGVSRAAALKALVADGHATETELAVVSGARISDMMAEAGLTRRWQELSDGEYERSGSPMLVERAMTAFGNGWVGVRVVAELMGQSVERTTTELTDKGWIAATG